MKNLIAATIVGALMTSVPVSAATEELKTLNKELEIMSGVIDTALKQSSPRKGLRYRSLDSTYLAGQGVVFSVSVRNSQSGFSLRNIFSHVPEAPMPPVTIIDGDSQFEVEFEEEWEVVAAEMEEAGQRLAEIFHESNDQIRELRDRERELEWERRELERRTRDLEFELRQSGKERSEDIKEELKEVSNELAQLDSQEKELESYATKMEQEQQARVEAQREAQEKAYKQFLANFEGSIGDTLCRFGSGLRGLPDNEHISFVLEQFSRDDKGDMQDRIYVFSKEKVKSCVQERIDASLLLSSARVYTF